mgnify:FL=1
MRLYLPENCKNKRVCVALSGGGDSVALLYALKEKAGEWNMPLSAVNVEHGIRGESSLADTEFVKKLCGKENIPLYCYSEDVPRLAEEWGMGAEAAARAVRYRIFLDILRQDKADCIATAHHAGDNAESVLFNLFRGSALTGAGGIRGFVNARELAAAFSPETCAEDEKVLRGKGIVRPFLGVPKSEILAYLRENKLEWREDESNADPAYTRNFLRREVLAPARERFPALDQALYNFSRAAREDDEFLYTSAEEYFTAGEVCFVSENAPKPLFLRACLLALRHFGVEKDYTFENLNDVYALLHSENGKAVDLPQGIVARREYGKIALYKPEKKAETAETPFGEGIFDFGFCNVQILKGAFSVVGEFRTSRRQLVLDGDKLPEGCVLRTRKEGDVFQKFGSGTKKLKDYFIDEKIPRRERDNIPLVACGKEVFAVCGVEISDKVKLDGGSENILTIILFEKGDSYKCIRT